MQYVKEHKTIFSNSTVSEKTGLLTLTIAISNKH